VEINSWRRRSRCFEQPKGDDRRIGASDGHTTYAVLTGLRKRGYTLTLDRFDAERGSAYRIVLDANATQEETAPTAVEPPIVSATCFAK